MRHFFTRLLFLALAACGGSGDLGILRVTSMDGWSSYPVPRVAANASGKTLAIWGLDSY